MRNNIIDIFAEYDDITHVFILTYNIDFIFLQTVLVPALRRCGHPSLTIYADAHQAMNSFSEQMDWIDGAGVRYRVIPVDLGNHFSFHPKAVLLSGEKNGRLLVGSGNLTHGGWVENAEIWIQYDSEEEGCGPFYQIRDYINKITSYVPNSKRLSHELLDAFSPDLHKWIKPTSEGEITIFGRFNDDYSLYSKISDVLIGKEIDKLIICSPYFDENGSMVLNLKKHLNIRNVDVLFDANGHTLTKKAAENLKKNGINTKPIKFERSEGHGAFVHAKFYGFITKNEVYVFSGSANCSIAAMGIDAAGRGNAELLNLVVMSAEQFSEHYINEIVDEDETLTEYYEPSISEENHDKDVKFIRIVAARFDENGLVVSYRISSGLTIEKCVVNDLSQPFVEKENDEITIKKVISPRKVFLTATTAGEEIISNVMWVDNEFMLGDTAKRRSLVNIISSGVTNSTWSVNVWIELLDKYRENLMCTPSWKKVHVEKRDDREEADVLYSREDIFYRYKALPTRFNFPRPDGPHNRILTLQQILLQWFGYGWKGKDNENSIPSVCESTDDERELIDRARRDFTSYERSRNDVQITQTIKNSIHRRLIALAETFEKKEFFTSRPPDMIKVDIAFASLILRTGLVENWIDESDFINITHRIWRSLFFNGCTDVNISYSSGWLEFLYVNAQEPAEFMNNLCDVEISASLILWALAVKDAIDSPEAALFNLVVVASIARFRQLWSIDKSEELLNSITKQLQATSEYNPDSFNEKWENISQRWNKFLMRGAALARLQQIISRFDLPNLSKLIKTDSVYSGELLWQSSKFGFCVTKNNCKRIRGSSVGVISLHDPRSVKKISALYLIPIRGLLDNDDSSLLLSNLENESRKVIREYIDVLSGKLTR